MGCGPLFALAGPRPGLQPRQLRTQIRPWLHRPMRLSFALLSLKVPHAKVSLSWNLGEVDDHSPYFTFRIITLKSQRFFPHKKCTTFLHLLAYGSVAHSIDEHIKIGKIIDLDFSEHLYGGVISCFGKKYSRHPTYDGLKRLLAKEEEIS